MSFEIPAGPRSLPRQSQLEGQFTNAAVIPAGLTFTGEACFPADVVIEGHVHGTASTPSSGAAHIAASGILEGSLRAGSARVDGRVQGHIDCPAGVVEFGPTARCEVDVLYLELDMARGSNVQATLRQSGGVHGQ